MPPAIPISAFRASPGPFTAQPITATVISASMVCRNSSTCLAIGIKSIIVLPHVGHATKVGVFLYKPQSFKISFATFISSTGSSDKETLTVTISPSDATDKTITWSSSDEKVAKVSSKGVVTAVSKGTATIIATSSNGKKANCEVTVTKKEVTKSTDTSLKFLKVTNGTLDKDFDNDTTKYTVTVDKSITELEFDFEFNDKAAKYLISNNNSIISGKIVRFIAIAEDGETSKIYNIVVKKNEVTEEENENLNEDIEANNEKIDNEIENETEKDSLTWIIAIIALSIIIITSIIIILKRKLGV